MEGIWGSGYDFGNAIERGWGRYTVVHDDKGFQIRIVEVDPFKSIQNQFHRKRSEHWVVINGTAKLYIDAEYKLIRTGESAFIPAGMKHKVINPVGIPLIMVEVHTGEVDESDSVTVK